MIRFDSVEIKGLIPSCGVGFRYITSYNPLKEIKEEENTRGKEVGKPSHDETRDKGSAD